MKNILLYILLTILCWGNIQLVETRKNNDALQVIILDVGQGQAVLLSYKGFNVLIDTGEEPQVLDELARYLPYYEKSFDYVVITHPHSDHYGAYQLIKKRYTVKNMIVSRLIGTNLMYQEVINSSKENLFMVPNSMHFQIEQVSIDLIQLPPPYNDRNNSSIVTRISYNDTTFLITGDLEKEREPELVSEILKTPIHYYVAGHHGSNTSSSIGFLNKINPQQTVISVGKENSFGHPSPETLLSLEIIKSTILRTDELGSIRIVCTETLCNTIY